MDLSAPSRATRVAGYSSTPTGRTARSPCPSWPRWATPRYNDSIEAQNGASILISSLTGLDRVDLTIRDTASVPTKQIASYKAGTLYVSGGAAPDFSGLTTLDFTTGGHPAGRRRRQRPGPAGAEDTPGRHRLRRLLRQRHRRRQGGPHRHHERRGRPRTVLRRRDEQHDRPVQAPALGDTAAYNDSIEAQNGASVLIPSITGLDRVDLTIRDTASVSTRQIASYKAGDAVRQRRRTPDFSGLTTLDFTTGGTLQADGAGSVLALPALQDTPGRHRLRRLLRQRHRRRRGGPLRHHERLGRPGPVLRRRDEQHDRPVRARRAGLHRRLQLLDRGAGRRVGPDAPDDRPRPRRPDHPRLRVGQHQADRLLFLAATLYVSGGAAPDFSGPGRPRLHPGAAPCRPTAPAASWPCRAYTTLAGRHRLHDSHVNATGGGEVDLSKLTERFGRPGPALCHGTGSTIDLSGLPRYRLRAAYNSSINARTAPRSRWRAGRSN